MGVRACSNPEAYPWIRYRAGRSAGSALAREVRYATLSGGPRSSNSESVKSVSDQLADVLTRGPEATLRHQSFHELFQRVRQ